IKIFIRSDDPKRGTIGEAISSDFEKIGFTVEKIFGDLSRAQLDVYGSNPQDLKWQVYTEAYAGTAAFVAYNPTVPAQMYAPWYSNMPGRGNAAFWQYANKTLDNITQKILLGNFTSKEEKTELVRKAITQGIQESVRIFIAQTKEPYVASSTLKGLVNDFGAGISSRFSFIDAMPQSNNNTLNVGVRQISQGAWNNIGGYKDAYSITILSSLYDPATLRHPYLGTVIPIRNNWTNIETKGPAGFLSVSPDTIKWNPYISQWKPVGDNQTAKSKVTYKILYSKWHNGIPMDKNDLLYSYYFGFEWGTNSTSANSVDRTIDPEFTPTAAASLPTLKGIRFLTNDTVESYVDYWHFDDKEIADYATVWATEPWEITAAQERLVEAGKLSYSSSGAVQKGVDWLSVVNPQHVAMIKEELQKMKDEQYIPPALKGLVSTDEAIKRYDASIKWITDHNNAVISNGPFYLDSFNAAGQTATIKAFRDSSYPFAKGYWISKFGEPKIASVQGIDTQGPLIMGQPKSIKISISIAGQPSNDAQVKYLISGNNGVITEGDATPSTGQNGQFEINLKSNETSQFRPGANTLKVFAISNSAYKLASFSSPILVFANQSTSGSNQSNSGSNQGSSSTTNNNVNNNNNKSGCLIATAAFGSELTPQVQYLRNFRQNYILTTTSGSAFMNTFNTIYYSFSPGVAQYEREQPWLQTTVKGALYPLFGILMTAERAYKFANGNEAGSIMAGVVASSLIGVVYIAPLVAAYNIGFKKK
ncbi:MAG TPA: CFI-box-CTERM domain-containing protein, partial [Nitrososphaera sp.]|nr:CFI-box-CTERM domain-containing protein [Nitrososphaera sp.]